MSWCSDIVPNANLPPRLHAWLTRPQRLYQALQWVYGEISVNVLSQTHATMCADEALALKLPTSNAFIREVYLMHRDTPLIYGRVVVPTRTFEAFEPQFLALDTKPIGDTLLYGFEDITRSPFEYRSLSGQEFFTYHEVTSPLLLSTLLSTDTNLWARRSIFHKQDYPLLIMEAFLPALRIYSSI